VKILHTADLHLRERGDERWEALRALVDLGRREGVGALIVAGDLFDTDAAAQKLRGEVREVFSGTGFPVLLLPGNHDRDSYGGGRYFGEDARVLGPEPVPCGDVVFVGLPYREMPGEEVIAAIREAAPALADAEVGILVYHGELLDALPLDTSRGDFGDEGLGRYMPVRLSYFDGVPADYVLAGHFHSRFAEWRLPGGGFFVYPGSPVSITRRETGPRRVNLFEVGGPPLPRELDTPYYEEVVVILDPFDAADPVALVAERLRAAEPHARVLLRVEGYVDAAALGRTEEQLVREVKDAAGDCLEVPPTFGDISRVLGNDLFVEFRERLEEREGDGERRRALLEMATRAMMEAL